MQDKNDFHCAGHPVRLVHLTSGRIRLKAIAPTEFVFKILSARLEQLDGVYEVECKLATGSLIIWFNEYRLTGQEVVNYLARSLESFPSFAPEETKTPGKTISIRAETVTESPAGSAVRRGVLKGLRGGVLKCSLAVFARYSLSELAQHSRREREKNLPPSFPKKSLWQKLKAIAR
ncbi:MAG: hypothetical protein AB4290_25765 [Spirulina sp.]